MITMHWLFIAVSWLVISLFVWGLQRREKRLEKTEEQFCAVFRTIQNIDLLRAEEGDSVEILCDNPEAITANTLGNVDVNGDWTGWKPRRFSGKTWQEALEKAVRARDLKDAASGKAKFYVREE